MNSRVYGGVDTESRRAERRGRLVAAALELLGTGGLQAMTVRKVCEATRLSSRYFYESFADIDALMVAVHEGIVDELIVAGLAALDHAPTDTPSQVRAGLGSAVDLVADDPRKGHVIFSLALASPPLAQRRLQASEQMAQLMIELGRDRFTPGTTPRQLLFASRFLVGGFSEILAAWLRAPGDATRDEILDQCADLFLAAAAPLLKPPEG